MKNLFTLLLIALTANIGLGQVQQVKEIYPGAESGQPENIFHYKDFILFAAESPDEGMELWISDGTEEGTQILMDINSGQVSSFPAGFTEFDNLVYFSATTADEGRELWVTDGTASGTQLLKDINPGVANSGVRDLIVFQESLWMTATTESEGSELWVSDGTEAGTSLFFDLSPGTDNSAPDHKFVAQFSDRMYFSAVSGTTGREVFVTDGTQSGTQLVEDISPDTSSSDPMDFVEADGLVYFTAETEALGRELYVTEGDASSTRLIKDLYPGSTGSDPTNLNVIGIPFFTGQVLFYIGAEDTSGTKLYAYLSSADTIFQYLNLNSQGSMRPENLGNFAGLALYFSGYFTIQGPSGIDTIGRELFLVDVFGFLSDTAEAGEISVMTLIGDDNASFDDITIDTLDGFMYYSVETDRAGKEIYRTPLFSNFLLHERLSDINPREGSSEVEEITAVGKNIFFRATDGSNGNELYKYQAELGEVEVVQLPSRIEVMEGDTVDLGIVEVNSDTILQFEFGRATTPSVRVEQVYIEGNGYFNTPITPVTFSRLGPEVRDTFLIEYVATEEGNVDVGTVYLENDYAETDTFRFYIKAEVDMEVSSEAPFASEWKLFPNPVQHEALLSGPAVEKRGQIKVINSRGEVILEQALNPFDSDQAIKVHNLPSGQYFIYMVNEEGQQRVIPFIKG